MCYCNIVIPLKVCSFHLFVLFCLLVISSLRKGLPHSTARQARVKYLVQAWDSLKFSCLGLLSFWIIQMSQEAQLVFSCLVNLPVPFLWLHITCLWPLLCLISLLWIVRNSSLPSLCDFLEVYIEDAHIFLLPHPQPRPQSSTGKAYAHSAACFTEGVLSCSVSPFLYFFE